MKADYIGQVFWHGLFPDVTKRGRVVKRGTLRHEVLWDGYNETVLVWTTALRLVSDFGTCCAYCRSLLERAT
jgi:hypothetical protein